MNNGSLTTIEVGFKAKYIAIYITNNYQFAYVDDKNNIQYVLRADEMTQYIVVNDTNVQIYCEWGTGTRTATVMIAS